MIKWKPIFAEVSKLKATPINPKIKSEIGVRRLKKSVEKFGLAGTIICNRDLTIIDGNSRLEEIIKTGVKKVWVSVPDKQLSETEFKQFNALHDLAVAGESDMVLIEEIIGEEVLNEFEFGKPEIVEDDYEPPAEIVTDIKRGDLFELSGNGLKHWLLCGDSTNAEDVKKLLDGICPILMVTDPPYGVNYDPNWRNKALRSDGTPIGARAIGAVKNDHQIDWSKAFALFNGNVVYTWHSGRYAKQVHEHLENSGFEIVAQIIWAKNGHVIGRGDYHFQHEPCWYAVRKKQKHNWQGSRSETSLWEIPRNLKNETGHSTQKPVECMARPIRNNSKEGDLIYDPFLGSGTTLLAAMQLKRNCFGVEISPLYCAVILRRLKLFDNNIQIKCLNRIFDIEKEITSCEKQEDIKNV